jgi:hypothetical protein
VTEFEAIAPSQTAATFKGRAIQITPLKVGQLPAFARAVKPIGGAVESMLGSDGVDMGAIMALIADHGESVVEAVAIASGVSVDELNDSTPDELIELGAVALKVNADFFKGRLTPAILAAVKKATPGAGLTP